MIHFLVSFRFLHKRYLSKEVFLITLIEIAIPLFFYFPTCFPSFLPALFFYMVLITI